MRIGRACRDLGIDTVQVYSQPDADSTPVRMAGSAIGIGGARARESYLNRAAIIGAAMFGDCDAIHPGYGFLSEDPCLAQLCLDQGIVFIGPRPETLRLMGNKSAARSLAKESGIPVIPGSDGPVADQHEALEAARRIGFPILLKASAGGGGRGIRVVEHERELPGQLPSARAEAESAFGDSSVYMERYLPDIRHVEVQVIGDGRNIVHLGERDCTVQRRHQKLVEEGPSPAIDDDIRGRLTEAALALAQRVDYENAGTVEFVLDNRTREFYFIEMNPRLQVEHPVTEMITGIDIVEQQIRLAGGEPLGLAQRDVRTNGWAIECRINAEDASRGFMPCPGTITGLSLPDDPLVRIDTHVCPGASIPPYYDSLVAKVIVTDRTRVEAIGRMQAALADLAVEGVETNIALHQRILVDPHFAAGAFNTRLVDNIAADDRSGAAGARAQR